MEEKFSILNTTKSALPGAPFGLIKEKVVGKKYSLSLVFISEKKSKNLNKIYRNKNKPANILSFPYDKNEGEIFICSSKAKKESSFFNKNYRDFLILLFIHGLLHLKGMKHGSIMERTEEKLLKKFGI